MLAAVALGTLAGIAGSGLAVRLVLARVPAVRLAEPRWGPPEMLLIIGLWMVLEIAVAGCAAMGLDLIARAVGEWTPEPAFRGLVVEELARDWIRLPQIALSGLARVACAGCGVLVVRALGQAPEAIGIALRGDPPAGLSAALRTGLPAFLAATPGWLLLTELWSVGLVALGIDLDGQAITAEFLGAVSRGELLLPLAIAATGVVGAPLLEEVLFRCLFFRWLLARAGRLVATFLSALLFAAIHGNLFASFPIFILGCLLAEIYRRTGNLWATIVAHATFNACQFVLMIVASTT